MTSSKEVLNFAMDMERQVAELVQKANTFDSRIYLSYGTKKVNAKSIMGMMTMELGNGDTITIEADGADEEAAVREIAQYLTAGQNG